MNYKDSGKGNKNKTLHYPSKNVIVVPVIIKT